MLVLTRRRNESIILDHSIKITILEIDSDRIRIGIDAPHNMKIMRAELLDEIKNANREAIRTDLDFLQQWQPEQPDKKTEENCI
ncbi:MAG: carbon storage regulator CsrA [Clostridiaceae bacterium]|nr:carbon storage regulator CsrA [Clostridiaceae bacterium]